MSLGRRLPKQASSALPEKGPSNAREPVDFSALYSRQAYPNARGELTFREAAVYLEITTRALQQRIKDGKPHPPFVVRFGRRYFPLDTLQSWQDQDFDAA